MNVLLIDIDSLRADHLGCYGYPRPTSPRIDALAGSGTLFLNAFATSATTAPSHASMMTGLHPFEHAILANGDGPVAAEISTLAELLRERGYQTAAFTSITGTFVRAGLDRGFEVFRTPEVGTGIPASVVTSSAVHWLAGRDHGRPLFLWVHLWDPHSPYEPLEPFTSGSARRDRKLASSLTRTRAVDLALFHGKVRNYLELVNAYDGEVAAADRAVGALLAACSPAPGRRPVTAIVTSDHGEGLGDHGWLLHGKHLYNEQLRVPLVVHSSDGDGTPRQIAEVVQGVDLFPTLLELGGAPVPPAQGHRATSLVGLVAGHPQPGRAKLAFSQRRSFSGPPPEPAPPRTGAREPFTLDRLLERSIAENFEIGAGFAIQDGRHKLIMKTELPDELYDLEADPWEKNNLAGRGLAAEDRLRDALLGLLDGAATPKDAPLLDPETLEELEALGYVH